MLIGVRALIRNSVVIADSALDGDIVMAGESALIGDN